MSYDYSKAASNALKQINDKGRALTVREPSDDQVFDPENFTFEEGTPEDTDVKGLFTQFATKDVDGEVIMRTDKRVLIPANALSAAPSNSAKIIDGGTEYQVINTEVLQPGDTPILYMVQVRR